MKSRLTADDRPNLVAVLITLLVEALLRQALAHLLYERVHLGDRDGEVVLVDRAALAGRLRDRLAKGPERSELRRVLSKDAVRNDLRLKQMLK